MAPRPQCLPLLFMLVVVAAVHAQPHPGETDGASSEPGPVEELSRTIREVRDELSAIRGRVNALDRTVEGVAEAAGVSPEPIHVNTADADQLQRIEDIGPGLARRIIEGRPYSGVSDLMRVEGIGEVRLGSILGRMVFGPPETAEGESSSREEAGTEGGVRTIHVSSADGSDTNGGLSDADPVRTLQRGMSLLRDRTGDRLLLKRGDVWTDETFGQWKLSGRSADEPMVLGAYGDPSEPRPVIEVGYETGIRLWYNTDRPPSHIIVRDLHFYAHTRDPDSPRFNADHTGRAVEGIRCRSTGENITIENCRFDFCCVTVHNPDGRLKGFTFRNNVVYGDYAAGAHAQGIYVNHVDGLLIENNLFDRNGWNPDVEGAERTVFNHNIYCSSRNTGVVIRRNVLARASFSGIQARSGGVVVENLFWRNNLHLHYSGSPDATDAHRIADNAMLAGDDWRDGPMMAINVSDADGLTIEGNVLARDVGRPINLSSENGITDLTITGNVSAASTSFLYVFHEGFEKVKIIGNIYGGDRIRDRDGMGVDFEFTGNREGADIALPDALPDGWLEQARERWGEEGYTAEDAMERVRP